ncbi:MAG: hypothetical protein J0L92_39070 [Deltaproteobacteria bacterium]|jgi:hypothetical protein|nr:hypothetical protein [Deltaproteobacteria bacterium]
MEHSKLFKVLVVSGAALASGCGAVAPSGGEDARLEEPDAPAVGDAAAGATGPADDAGALENCGICPNEICCVTDESGTHTLPGMM